MTDLQKLLRRMQQDVTSVKHEINELAHDLSLTNDKLRLKTNEVKSAREDRNDAAEQLNAAQEEVESSQHKIQAAADAVRCGLTQPTPLVSYEPAGTGGEAAARASCAIVSTLKGIPGAELETWLSWHLTRQGFTKIFLFFDAPEEMAEAKKILDKWGNRIVATPVEEVFLEAEYRQCRRWKVLKHKLHEDWLARQELHVEIAMRWAAVDGIEWFLNIDLDELFVLGASGSSSSDRSGGPDAGAVPLIAPMHFGAVPAGVNTVQYLNHEGVPEVSRHDGMMVNRFESVTLFRRNPRCFTGDWEPDAGGGGVAEVFAWQLQLASLPGDGPGSGTSRNVSQQQ